MPSLARRVSRPAPVLALLTALAFAAIAVGGAAGAHAPSAASARVPHYDHVFLIIMENNGYREIIGSRFAPVLTALAHDYGIATDYRAVGDPSEPNYVAMLGGSTFGIANDNPYFFPGQTVHAANLMSQLEEAGKSWKGYFQGMPYAGYRGYCYPDKCNGIPDSDTQYVVKHNGIANFANMQNPADFAKMVPLQRLTDDLRARTVPNLSYIVGDECDDMHGAPPWCVDSSVPGTVQQDWLIAHGDLFVRNVVDEITASSTWSTGRNAVVVTFDEGNFTYSRVATIVMVNHGPRGLVDGTPYNHYSLLRSLQEAFGLGCLLHSCTATPMAPLFATTGSSSLPGLPPAAELSTGPGTVSAQSAGTSVAAADLNAAHGWTKVPSYSYGIQDNVLASVAAASATDAWAVGAYYPSAVSPLHTLGLHFDGTRWTSYRLPDVGIEENVLLGVSTPAPGDAWAVGYYLNGQFHQRTLVEHFDGKVWSVVASPDPSALQNILYAVSSVSKTDIWAVGAETDASGLWHTLTVHWNGAKWSVVPAPNPGAGGNQLYAVKALAPDNVWAVGQQAGSAFPNRALLEHWDGADWNVVASPPDPSASALPLGVAVTGSELTLVGQQETDTHPYTTYVASGTAGHVSVRPSPDATRGENDLFGAVGAPDGSTWAVGWAIYSRSTFNHEPIVLHFKDGVWSLVPSANLGAGADSGLSSVATIPGGGMWAVGETASANGSGGYQTLIEYYP